MAALARLGDSLYAVHYVCPGIGKVALIDELSAYSNQTAWLRNAERAFIFVGDSYRDVFTELERPPDKEDAKLLDYGGCTAASRCPSICCPVTAPERCSSKPWLCRTTGQG